jgi:hypothetical protein
LLAVAVVAHGIKLVVVELVVIETLLAQKHRAVIHLLKPQ